jgi:DNA polymerase-3 subunit gamma/tau
VGYLVLARKWRPQTFDEVVGQEHVTTTLANAIKTERVGHAYLFTGPRGVGKTTTARILARALNCESGPTPHPCGKCGACRSISAGSNLDVLEIDGASNRGIDDVRELREQVRYAPSEGRYKVYIIDEVHMLTDQAFNALLKTLEEPPAHVVFVFATTSPQKIPMTILSRCQRFDFNLIPAERILQRLKAITKKENFRIDDAALALVARKARGSLRDAESLLDQVTSASDGPIDEDSVTELLGIGRSDLYFAVCDNITKSDAGSALKDADSALRAGLDVGEFMSGLIEHLRALFLLSIGPGLEEALGVPGSELPAYKEQAAKFKQKELLRLLEIASEAAATMRRSEDPRFHAEVALARMAEMGTEEGLSDVLRRLEELETRLASGAGAPVTADEGSHGKAPAKRGVTSSARKTTASTGRGKTRADAFGESGAYGAGNSASAGSAATSAVGATGVGAAGTGPEAPSLQENDEPRRLELSSDQVIGDNAAAWAPRTQGADEARVEPSTGSAAPAALGADPPAPGLESTEEVKEHAGSPSASAGRDDEGEEEGALTHARLESLWNEVIKKVTEEKTYLGNFLSVAVPMEANGEDLALGFPEGFSFHKEQVSAHSNKRLVQEAMHDVFGKFLRLRFLTIKGAAPGEHPRAEAPGSGGDGERAVGIPELPQGGPRMMGWQNGSARPIGGAVDSAGDADPELESMGLIGEPEPYDGMAVDPLRGSTPALGVDRSRRLVGSSDGVLHAAASAAEKLDDPLRMVIELFEGEIVSESEVRSRT